MKNVISLIAVAASSLSGASQGQAYVPDGVWQMSFYAPEGVHKLMFVIPDSAHAAVYLHCEPQSGSISLSYDAPDIDIRSYVPHVRTSSGEKLEQFEIKYSEPMGEYYVVYELSPSAQFILSLSNNDDLLIDNARYRVSDPYDGMVIREFARSCGGRI